MDPLRRMQEIVSAFSQDNFQPIINQLAISQTPRQQPSLRAENFMKVPRGQFTFDQEGIESPGKRYHSRSASIPYEGSGITIGRGFDLGQFTSQQIRQTLIKSNFDNAFIERAQGAALLESQAARTYLITNPIRDITMQEQWSLFNELRNYMERDVERISQKADTVATYGEVPWQSLARITQDLIVDLRYRGDYTTNTRKLIQPVLVSNDTYNLAQILSDESYWVVERGVPRERFLARKRLALSQLD